MTLEAMFSVPDFLSVEETSEVLATMRSIDWGTGSVLVTEKEYSVSTDIRSVKVGYLPPHLEHAIIERLKTMIPSLNGLYGVSIKDFSKPNLLRYQQGDHYTWHKDFNEKSIGQATRRKISIVIFVNDPEEKDHPYEGGLLQLANEQDDLVSIKGKCGLLIGFPSTTLHQVTKVTSGERFTTVVWLLE